MDLKIDAALHARMVRYCGGDPREPRTVTETVISESGDWSLKDFLEMVTTAAAKIPEELLASAEVSVSGGYDDDSTIEITYKRQNTPEEVSARIKGALEYAMREAAQEMATYERLKAKFDAS